MAGWLLNTSMSMRSQRKQPSFFAPSPRRNATRAGSEEGRLFSQAIVWEGGVTFLQQHIQLTTCFVLFVSNSAWEGDFTTTLIQVWGTWSRMGYPFSFPRKGYIISNVQELIKLSAAISNYIHREFAQKKSLRNQLNSCSLCCSRYAMARSLWWGYRKT